MWVEGVEFLTECVSLVVNLRLIRVFGYTTVFDKLYLAAAGAGRAGLSVSEVHDVYSGLVPPVKHHNHKDVPHLVAGAQVVQLS